MVLHAKGGARKNISTSLMSFLSTHRSSSTTAHLGLGSKETGFSYRVGISVLKRVALSKVN